MRRPKIGVGIPTKCLWCKEEFLAWPCGLKVGKQKFCSKSCYTKSMYKEDRRITPQGYVIVRDFGNPKAKSSGWILEHVLIAERVLGKPLPKNAEIHHWNKNKQDNNNPNLLICPGRAYHKLIHQRMNIKAAGGNPNTDRLCSICKLPKDAVIFFSPTSNRCRPCIKTYQRRREKNAS